MDVIESFLESLKFKLDGSFFIVLIICFLPSIIAFNKKKKNQTAILLTNVIPLFFGKIVYFDDGNPYTSELYKATKNGYFQITVIGLVVWIIALIWATTNDSQEKNNEG